jgi:hydrogenase maturation protease
MRILVAGIGNIFFGDDAFGIEVIRELVRETFPEEVRVEDFGIRSYDLAYAIMDGYEAVILIDATPQGRAPGTVSLMELDGSKVVSGEDTVVNAHSMNPIRVLQMVESLGGAMERLYLVGCEPAVLETDELGLSPVVTAAVPQAVEMIKAFVKALLSGTLEEFLHESQGCPR